MKSIKDLASAEELAAWVLIDKYDPSKVPEHLIPLLVRVTQAVKEIQQIRDALWEQVVGCDLAAAQKMARGCKLVDPEGYQGGNWSQTRAIERNEITRKAMVRTIFENGPQPAKTLGRMYGILQGGDRLFALLNHRWFDRGVNGVGITDQAREQVLGQSLQPVGEGEREGSK